MVKITSYNVLFYPQPKYIQFTVIQDERNQKIITFGRFFTLKMAQNSQKAKYMVVYSRYRNPNTCISFILK